ncbi:Zn-ribbon domain-containing OB-fold protein [Stutzerimonas tarimensis]|uniref:Zn-ribbon domain-containing OB-fold protein n=1 Tax=Stutzerimonas tarimensis TaxID=1507735 RepID=A0ABV7TAC7_9GAMM
MAESKGGVQAQYQAALDRGEFLIQCCGACTRAVFFPRELCPHCGAPDPQWQAPSGRGVVYATTVVRRKPEAGGNYNIALVDLEEGVRVMSRIEGLAAEDVRIGLPVQAYVEINGGTGKLLFTLSDKEASNEYA